MKSMETELALRALIAKGVSAMALLFLVACATTSTAPVSRQADPALARKVVTYPTPVSPGTIVIDPGSHFLYLVGRFHGSNHMPTRIGSLRCSCGMPG